MKILTIVLLSFFCEYSKCSRVIETFQKTNISTNNYKGFMRTGYNHIQKDLFEYGNELKRLGVSPKVFFEGIGKGAIPVDFYNHLKGKGDFIFNDLSEEHLSLLKEKTSELKI